LLIQCLVKDFIDEKIYNRIHQTLVEDYPDQKVKTDCLIHHYKERKLADEFYTFDIILNPSKVRVAVQKIVEEANLKCSFVQFVYSIFGVSVLAVIIVFVCGLFCTIGRKMYQKCCGNSNYISVRKT
jgi:hypothetical protein